jgi:hypothetical protein
MKYMKTEIQKKQRRLKAEIEIAERQLKANLSRIKMLDYLPGVAQSAIPIAASQFVGGPSEILKSADSIARGFLSEDHWLRQILKHTKTIMTGIAILMPLLHAESPSNNSESDI